MAGTVKPSVIETIRQLLETYGVGVRAGVLTPCAEDEAEFRKLLGLPAMPEKVQADWKDSDGIRRPITLQRPDATEGPDPFAVSAGVQDEEGKQEQ